jgi:hypothetical protein
MADIRDARDCVQRRRDSLHQSETSQVQSISNLPRRSSTTTTLDRNLALPPILRSQTPCQKLPTTLRPMSQISPDESFSSLVVCSLDNLPIFRIVANVTLQAQLVSAHLPSPSSLRRTLRTSSSAAEIRSEPPNSSPKSSKPRHPPSSLFSNVTCQVLPLCNHRPRSFRLNQTV